MIWLSKIQTDYFEFTWKCYKHSVSIISRFVWLFFVATESIHSRFWQNPNLSHVQMLPFVLLTVHDRLVSCQFYKNISLNIPI